MSKAWLSAPIAYMIKAEKKVATMTPIKPLEEKLSLAQGIQKNTIEFHYHENSGKTREDKNLK